jgi:hypothetical protein
MANEYELASADVIAKYKAQTSAKPASAKTAASPTGYNDRQRVGVQLIYDNTLNYAEAITGLSKAQLALMTPAQIEKAVKERGKRTFQGAVMGNIPLVSKIANADIRPYSMGAAQGQAAINNPTGQVTEPDINAAMAMQPNIGQPIDTQARLIRQNLETALKGQPQNTAPAGWSIKKVK